MARVQAYVAGNFDGTYEVAVAATTMGEAARKMGTTVYQMRTYGWSKSDYILEVIEDPATVFRRKINSRCVFEPWRPSA